MVAMPLKICQVTTSVLRLDLSKKLNIPIPLYSDLPV